MAAPGRPKLYPTDEARREARAEQQRRRRASKLAPPKPSLDEAKALLVATFKAATSNTHAVQTKAASPAEEQMIRKALAAQHAALLREAGALLERCL